MKSPLICLPILLLAACGADPAPDATAAGALGEAECRVLAERHRDYAISVAPPGQEAAMREFVDAGMKTITEECTTGGMFDREAYDCVAATAPGSAESHACITDAHARG